MALTIQSPAELRFSSRLDRHALSTLKMQAFIFESAVQSVQDVPESAVQKYKCGPPVLLILLAPASCADANISSLSECV
eukprot:1076672-Pelagomonas_calceolata.AAC.3